MSVTWLNLSFPLNRNFQIACAVYKGQRLLKVGVKYFFLVLRKSVSGTNLQYCSLLARGIEGSCFFFVSRMITF